MLSIPNDILALAAIISAIMGTVWTFAWWLSNKFNDMMSVFYAKIDSAATMILDKLEYHERHDDTRFSALGESINALRIRNATADALIQKKFLETQ